MKWLVREAEETEARAKGAGRSLWHKPLWLGLAALVLGLQITRLVADSINAQLELSYEQKFASLSEKVRSELTQRLDQLTVGIRGLRGPFVSSENVTGDEFRAYVESQNVNEEFAAGVLAMGYIERVERDRLADFLRKAENDRGRPLRVTTSGNRSDLFIVKYVEPAATNREADGLDIGAENFRRSAAIQAMRTGEPTLTHVIELCQHDAKGLGMLYLLPIYRSGAPINTEAERVAACTGWVYIPIVTEQVMKGIEDASDRLVDYELWDSSSRFEEHNVYDADQHGMDTDHVHSYQKRDILRVGGRRWVLATMASTSFDSIFNKNAVVDTWWVGGALSVLFAILLWSLANSQHLASLVAHRVNRDLVRAKEDAEDALRHTYTLRRALDSHAIVSVADHRGQIIDINDQFCEVSGYSREELLGKDHRILNSGFHPRAFWVQMWRTIGHGNPWRGEVCNRAKDGSLYWVDSTIIPVLGRDGRVEQYVSIRFDITQRKGIEAQVHRLALIAERTQNAVIITDPVGRVEWVNEAFTRMTGYRLDEVKGVIPGHLLQGPLTEPGQVAMLRDAVKQGHRANAELVNYTKDGDDYIVRIEVEPLIEDGEVTGFMAIESDVTEERAMQDALLYAAQADRLTGLANRNLILTYLQSILEAGRTDYAVYFLDFDRFKLINDSLGHSVGDDLLREIAKRLTSTSGLNLGSNDRVARLGGDEFVIVVDGVTGTAVETIAGHLLEVLSRPYAIGDHVLHSTASVGIVTGELASVRGCNLAEDLLRDADTAMYEAKVAGKGCYRFFDWSMHERVQRRLALENDLRLAIERREFRVVYQPIVSIETGRMEKMEALVRWHHPERGIVAPDLFIPIAEDTGMIVPIGEIVLRQACRDYAELARELGPLAPASISVNLSRNQLLQPNLIELVVEVLMENHLRPGSLHLEITESAIIQDQEVTLQTMRDLKSLGVRLDMDDFGTGYSSLSCLQQFPIDVLKIDKAFVARLGQQAQSDLLVDTVIRLAHNLGMKVVAEGIETTEQLAVLERLGCEYGQGYLFSKPIAFDALKPFVREFRVPTLRAA